MGRAGQQFRRLDEWLLEFEMEPSRTAILVAGKDRIVQHDEASTFMKGVGDKQRKAQAVKLGLAENGDDTAHLRGAAVGVQREAGLEVNGAPG